MAFNPKSEPRNRTMKNIATTAKTPEEALALKNEWLKKHGPMGTAMQDAIEKHEARQKKEKMLHILETQRQIKLIEANILLSMAAKRKAIQEKRRKEAEEIQKGMSPEERTLAHKKEEEAKAAAASENQTRSNITGDQKDLNIVYNTLLEGLLKEQVQQVQEQMARKKETVEGIKKAGNFDDAERFKSVKARIAAIEQQHAKPKANRPSANTFTQKKSSWVSDQQGGWVKQEESPQTTTTPKPALTAAQAKMEHVKPLVTNITRTGSDAETLAQKPQEFQPVSSIIPTPTLNLAPAPNTRTAREKRAEAQQTQMKPLPCTENAAGASSIAYQVPKNITPTALQEPAAPIPAAPTPMPLTPRAPRPPGAR